MRKKHILLVNDDGVNSDGIKLLAEKLVLIGFKVTIIAPNKEKSCYSHLITLFDNICYKTIKIEPNLEIYSLKGSPADCVKFGLLHIIKDKVDLIISGINNVMNVGNDIYYSGTVCAAIEGSLTNIPSIAISLDEFGHGYGDSINFIANNLDTFMSMILENKTILNINIPYADFQKIKGVKITMVGEKLYDDYYVKKFRGYVLKGLQREFVKTNQDTDVEVTADGYISISPIKIEFTSKSIYEKLKSAELKIKI